MSEDREPNILAHIPALPGTKIVTFDYDYYDDPNAEKFITRREQTIVVWEIQNTPYGSRAMPVCCDPLPPDFEMWCNHAIVHPGGKTDFNSVFGEEFTGRTLEEFEAFSEAMVRHEIASAHCMDCNKDLRGVKFFDPDSPSPMLKHDVWQSIVPGSEGRLCREDMETRLGRALTEDDLLPKPATSEEE